MDNILARNSHFAIKQLIYYPWYKLNFKGGMSLKVKWIIESDFPLGTKGKIYEVLNEHVLGKTKRVKWYKITNDMEETCWFPETYFEIVEEEKYP